MKKNLSLLLLILLLGAVTFFFIVTKSQQTMETVFKSTETESPKNIPDDILRIKGENGEVINLSIESIPIFKTYLESQADIKTEIERTQFEVLSTSTQENFILLKYNCGNKQCSTLLIKESDSKITSIALADGIFRDYEISPARNEILLRYGYNEGNEVSRHILIAIDLMKMKVIPFESTQLAKEYMYTPTWPIVNYQWIDNDKFLIQTPDLESSDFEMIKNWYASTTKKTREIEVLISKGKRLDSYNPITNENH